MQRIVIAIDCDDVKADEAVLAAAEAVERVAGAEVYRAYRDTKALERCGCGWLVPEAGRVFHEQGSLYGPTSPLCDLQRL